MTSLRKALKLLLILVGSFCVDAFVPTSISTKSKQQPQQYPSRTTFPNTNVITTTNTAGRSSNTQLYNFMGSDGGILGVGTPELFTILLVGYFVLGPSDLYKVVKEIGKFVQNIQTFSRDATTTINQNLESQLQVEEIRKAQRELNDAFNFRRSINVDEESEAFSVNVQTDRPGIKEGELTDTIVNESATATTAAAVASTAETGTAPTKKKIRRRVKRKTVDVAPEEEPPVFNNMESTIQQPSANNVPDLDMSAAEESLSDADERAMKAMQEANEQLRKEMEEEEAAKEMAKSGYDLSPSDEQSRFQAQMSNNWNEQILAKDTELEPLAKLMEQLALLEDEKNANDARLQEEFRLREENEERFYKEKRRLLEDAAAMIQAEAYSSSSSSSSAQAEESATTKG